MSQRVTPEWVKKELESLEPWSENVCGRDLDYGKVVALAEKKLDTLTDSELESRFKMIHPLDWSEVRKQALKKLKGPGKPAPKVRPKAQGKPDKSPVPVL